ncbi:MAG: rod shape-determining protein RodA [Acidimicrobiia bacterium]|jgi:rod shape determining protein RodA|nr:rod shape-determining protein RodA [Acidimicrobiia bacterium]
MNAPILPPRSDWRLGNFRVGPGDPSRNIDWSLIAAVVALTVIGAFAIYSATFWKVADDPYWFTVRQVVFAIVSAIVLAVTMSFDYTLLRERAFFLYGCALVALALVLAVGALRGGARLSFDLGPVLFQPAEFAKPAVIVVLAAYLAEIREDSVSYARFIGGLVLVGAPVVFIILQPDLGSAFVIIVGALVIFLMAGAKLRYLVMITFLTVVTVAAAVVAGVVDRYQLRRIEAFLNQNSTDDNLKDLVLQVRFAKRAVGTGGWFGKGYLEAPLTNGKFIPVQQSDFIFSAVAEQFGMLGGGVVIVLFALLLFRIWRVAHLSKDTFGTYICAGVFGMILWHVFQNIGMTMGIMPVTGVPLPFVSYGGSALVAFSMMIGLVESVHMRRMR